MSRKRIVVLIFFHEISSVSRALNIALIQINCPIHEELRGVYFYTCNRLRINESIYFLFL